jgi:pimeloyl-ACP methyl ester carboxylesterase
MPVDEFVSRLKGWTASWSPDEAIFPIILANFQIDEDERISPHLSFDHHMQIVRSIWEFRTYEQFQRVRCPALMIPVRPKGPLSKPDQRFLAAKERGVQKAKETLRGLHVAWMPDSIHDLPLQQPEKLARMIADFASTLTA